VTESDERPSSGEQAVHHEKTGNEPKRGLAQGLTGGVGAGGLVESGTPMGSSKGFHGVHLSPAMPAPSQPHPTAVYDPPRPREHAISAVLLMSSCPLFLFPSSTEHQAQDQPRQAGAVSATRALFLCPTGKPTDPEEGIARSGKPRAESSFV
jgi:hypothetical protein